MDPLYVLGVIKAKLSELRQYIRMVTQPDEMSATNAVSMLKPHEDNDRS